MKSLLCVSNRREWRAWLRKNHAEAGAVWLVFFKKHTGRRTLSYDDAVEEALCFGWIDSLIKRLDADRYARKFTLRTNKGKWSAANLKRVADLIEAGQMTAAGLAKIPANARAEPPVQARPLDPPAFFTEALERNPRARKHFEQLAPSYRRDYIHWVASAKREETRRRRLAEAVSLLARGRKLGLK